MSGGKSLNTFNAKYSGSGGGGGGGGGSGSRPATRSGEFGMKSAGSYVQYQQQQAGTTESCACSPRHTLRVKASFVELSAAL